VASKLPLSSTCWPHLYLCLAGVTSNGVTTYANVSTCTLEYRPDQAPLVFDLPK